MIHITAIERASILGGFRLSITGSIGSGVRGMMGLIHTYVLYYGRKVSRLGRVRYEMLLPTCFCFSVCTLYGFLFQIADWRRRWEIEYFTVSAALSLSSSYLLSLALITTPSWSRSCFMFVFNIWRRR